LHPPAELLPFEFGIELQFIVTVEETQEEVAFDQENPDKQKHWDRDTALPFELLTLEQLMRQPIPTQM
jgi:hypothetical protein